jgi:hypothetical protein
MFIIIEILRFEVPPSAILVERRYKILFNIIFHFILFL